MRGEFIGVWSETWREIWIPLIDTDGVPDDIFCELYWELSKALKEPSSASAIPLILDDAILRREVFDQSLALTVTEVDLARRDEVFDSAGTESLMSATERREALRLALEIIIGDPAKAEEALERGLSKIANDPEKCKEGFQRFTENVVNSKLLSREAFEKTRTEDLSGERALVAFFESAGTILNDIGGDLLANFYFNLLTAFIDKFSLRYELRQPCALCPTLPGMFTSLVRDLRAITSQDAHLDGLMKDFENAIRDLRNDCSDGRIKTCIQKQMNLLEAIGQSFPGVTETELGSICNQLGTWPHNAIKASLKNLYGFASDYPGIRHGGTPTHAIRTIEMRDMIAMAILLVGFTPYLTDQLNADFVYRGS